MHRYLFASRAFSVDSPTILGSIAIAEIKMDINAWFFIVPVCRLFLQMHRKLENTGKMFLLFNHCRICFKTNNHPIKIWIQTHFSDQYVKFIYNSIRFPNHLQTQSTSVVVMIDFPSPSPPPCPPSCLVHLGISRTKVSEMYSVFHMISWVFFIWMRFLIFLFKLQSPQLHFVIFFSKMDKISNFHILGCTGLSIFWKMH